MGGKIPWNSVTKPSHTQKDRATHEKSKAIFFPLLLQGTSRGFFSGRKRRCRNLFQPQNYPFVWALSWRDLAYDTKFTSNVTPRGAEIWEQSFPSSFTLPQDTDPSNKSTRDFQLPWLARSECCSPSTLAAPHPHTSSCNSQPHKYFTNKEYNHLYVPGM